jgi:4-amino-4-deoxy-L-arabinose transferase-like glycosyltransferase
MALFAPNLAWNAQHGFATFQETVAHFRIDATNLFNVNKIVEFMTGQALLLGPIVFFVLLGLFARASNRAAGISDEDRFLLAFTLPPLGIVTIQAIVAHADPNWAATAYPAALTWIAGSLLGGVNERRVFAAAMISNVVIGGIIAFSFLHPGSSGVLRGMRESTGWDETARAVALRATPLRGERPFGAVLVDDRSAYFQLNYYWTRLGAAAGTLPPLRIWQALGAHASNEGARALALTRAHACSWSTQRRRSSPSWPAISQRFARLKT